MAAAVRLLPIYFDAAFMRHWRCLLTQNTMSMPTTCESIVGTLHSIVPSFELLPRKIMFRQQNQFTLEIFLALFIALNRNYELAAFIHRYETGTAFFQNIAVGVFLAYSATP